MVPIVSSAQQSLQSRQASLAPHFLPNDRDISPLRGRVAIQNLNWNQVFAITTIVLAIAAPIAVAGAAVVVLAQQNASNSSCSGPQCASNGTCAISAYTPPTAVEEYLFRGEVEVSDQIQIQPIFFNYQKERQEFERVMGRVDQYLSKADTYQHPADRAVTLHQARRFVNQAKKSYFGRFENELQKLKQTILFEEVDACQEAAKSAPTAEKKMKWVRRAMEELNIPTRNLDVSSFRWLDRDKKTYEVAASLWTQAAEIFLTLPDRASGHCYVLISPTNDTFCHHLYAAARCFRNAAYCLQIQRNLKAEENMITKLTTALQYQKNIDTISWSFGDRAKLQGEIADTQGSIWSRFQNSLKAPELAELVYQESMKAAELYEQAVHEKPDNAYYQVKRAEQLMYAGNFASSLKKKVELYTQARELLEDTWNREPEMCRNIPEFTLQDYAYAHYRTFDLNLSLLGRLRLYVNEAQKALLEETVNPLDTRISYLCKKTTSWTEFFRR